MSQNNQLQKLRTDLNQQFPERRAVIEGSLAAVLAGEHVLMLGPPGTAKSALVRAIAQAFGGSYFERLMVRTTLPEEIWGPVSLSGLEQDRFVRVTKGKLAEAHFAFLDEIGRAGSTVLNGVLSAMNERIFHNDEAPTPIPLVSLFAASNSLINEPEQLALLDRFILIFEVQPIIRQANLRTILVGAEPQVTTRLDMKALRVMQAQVAKVKVTDATVDALISVRDALKADGIVASDRRWKKSLKLVQAVAFMGGETETTPEDLAILADALWREPKERQKIARVVGRLADPVSFQAAEILDAARETAAKVSSLSTGDRKSYLSQAGQSLQEFRDQQTRLNDLAKGAGRRAAETINDALAEVTSLHAELARAVSTGLGLGMRAVR